MSVDPFRRRFALWLGGLWAVALVVRLLYLWEVSDSPMWLVVMGDARAYDAWARRLAAGDWLGGDVFYQAPLYPYFLGAVYATLGDGAWTVRLVQCLLGATGCVLLALAGRRFVNRPVGLSAGALLALYPPAIFFDGLIQKTVLTMFLLNASLCLTAGLRRRPRSLPRWFAAGATIGLLALVRENALVLAVLTPLWAFVALRAFGWRRTGWAAAFLAGVAAVLNPVAARNAFVGGEWHLTTSQFGPNFYIGNNAGADGLYAPLLPDRGDALFERYDATTLAEQDEGRPLTPREVSRYWTRRAVADIAGHPVRWAGLLVRKLRLACGAFEIIDTEDQYTYAEYSRLLSSLMAVWHMGVLGPLAAFAALLLLPRPRWRARLGWPGLVVLGYAASLMMFFILGRYRMPFVPPMLLFATSGVWQAGALARAALSRSSLLPPPPPLLGPLSAALAAAALVAVPLNFDPYPVEDAKAVTRDNLGEHLFFKFLDNAGTPDEAMVRLVLEQYDRAVAMTPDDSNFRRNYAKVLWELGRKDAAQAQLETALARVPDDAVTLVDLGILLRDRQRYAASADRLRRAASLAHDLPEPSYHLAVTLLKWADEFGSAAAAAALESGPADDLGEIADGLEQANRMRTEAVALLRRSVALRPDSEGAHSALGSALASLGEKDEAALEFATAADLAPPGSAEQARWRHLQRRLEGVPKARRSVPPSVRRSRRM